MTAVRLLISLLLLSALAPFLSTFASVLHTRVPSTWQLLAPAPSSHQLTFFLAFPHRNVDQLEAQLSQLSDPTHPSYGQWMTAAEVKALISPLASTTSTVHQWLLSSGVPSSHVTHHGTAIEVQTTVEHVNRLFNTSLHRYRHSVDGTVHVVARGNISVPDDVLPHLAMILGVQDWPFPIRHYSVQALPRATTGRPDTSPPLSPSGRSASSPAPESAPHSFHPMQNYAVYDIMTARELAAYYGYPDLTQFARPANYVANTSIAVTQYDEIDVNGDLTKESINFADVVAQGILAGVPGIQANPTVYGQNDPTSAQFEPSLDIQTITTGNPTANATHWEENWTVWMYGVSLHLLAQNPPPQVVSISWGSTEDGADFGSPDDVAGGYLRYIQYTEVELAALGAIGVTVVVASGDNGANGDGNPGCLYDSEHPSSLYVSWPASSPHVVAVGATELSSGITTTSGPTPLCGLTAETLPSNITPEGLGAPYLFACYTNGTEVAVSSNFRSGGGFSRVYPQPSWQSSAVSSYVNSGVTLPPTGYYDPTKRAVPDVAMYGYGAGVVIGGRLTVLAGTSLSSPVFAVVVSLLNEVSLNAGGSTLGLLGPLLYYMAANVSGSFKDITSGDNVGTEGCLNSCHCEGFYATTGWDPVTGLGAPVYDVMAAYIRQLALSSPRVPPTSTASAVSPTATASLCFLFYGLPGNVDYPWSSAISLQLTYNPTLVNGSVGPAYSIVSGTGLRVYTNRFGAATTTSVKVDTTWPALVYPNAAVPIDAFGLTLDLASPVQLPGSGPSSIFQQLFLYDASGVVVEQGAFTVDLLGLAWLSSLPGFRNVTIGAANVNSLSVNYAACQAPISFTNGLRVPPQPTTFNGAVQFTFSYYISDGANYSVQTNLTVTTSSAFATTQDALGNQYQTIIDVTGTRLYSHFFTDLQLLSTVTGLSSEPAPTAGASVGDQHFYPYSLLAAAPGVYSLNTAPFFDADGLQFSVSPPIPVNGEAPGVGTQYSFTRVYVEDPDTLRLQYTPALATVTSTSRLVDGLFINPPLLALQRQSYSVAG